MALIKYSPVLPITHGLLLLARLAMQVVYLFILPDTPWQPRAPLSRSSSPEEAQSVIFALPSAMKQLEAWRGSPRTRPALSGARAEPGRAPAAPQLSPGRLAPSTCATKHASEPIFLCTDRAFALFSLFKREKITSRGIYTTKRTPQKNKNYPSRPFSGYYLQRRYSLALAAFGTAKSLFKPHKKSKSSSKRNLCVLLSKLFHVLFLSPAV